MGTAVGESLIAAVALLLAALPTVLVTLVLATRRPAAVSGAFVGGWMLGLAVVGGAVVAAVDVAAPGGPSPRWVGWAKVALGVLLLALAVRKWSGRPRDGRAPDIPGWVAAVGSLTAAKAFGLAFLMAAANPKNVVITVSAAVSISDATSRVADQVVALAVFVVVGSLGVAGPALLRRALGDRSGPVLEATDRWMASNSALIMAAVLAVLGVVLLSEGLAAL
ncbi:MAG TPA: GAP family protein, partial [Mycobacteriales bacterium]|nr:GAP family protein [Mycobacteriales bacterium]